MEANPPSDGFFLEDIQVAKFPNLHREGKYDNWVTMIRVWGGMHEDLPDTGGNLPDFAIYTHDGRRMGVVHGYGHKVTPGGYRDLELWHEKEYRDMDPTYLRIYAGGSDTLCLPAIAIRSPNGYTRVWTANLLTQCVNETIIQDIAFDYKHYRPRRGWHSSRTQIGTKAVSPNCVWLDRDDSYGNGLRAINLQIQDLVVTPEKQQAWYVDPALICHPSPRQEASRGTGHGNENKGLYAPLQIFWPPLEYRVNSKLDVDPTRITKYAASKSQLGPVEPSRIAEERYEDEYMPYKRWTIRGLSYLTQAVQRLHPRQLVSPTQLSPIPASVRKLAIVTNDKLSVRDTCRVILNASEPDYLSLTEKIYCNMQLHTMYNVCDETYTIGCFDTEINTLRKIIVNETIDDIHDPSVNNASRSAGVTSGVPVGGLLVPPFGIPYAAANVYTIS